jgi:hypothetical protein
MAKNKMREWLECATRDELDKLARYAKTTVGTIRQISGGYRTDGAASTTPEVARSIELASTKLLREGLPLIPRESLCPACAQCEYAKRCSRE